MQAFIDKDLVKFIKEGRAREVIAKICDPETHVKQIIWGLVDQQFQGCVKAHYVEFLNKIRACLMTATRSATSNEQDRACRFLESLRNELVAELSGAASTLLTSKMPDANDDVFNCDDQPDTFTTSSKDYVCQPTLERLAKSERTARKLAVGVHAAVLDLFSKFSYGADKGVRPRCGKPCPICRCPCTRTRGHTLSDDLQDKRHDTHHQPNGLIGWINSASTELAYSTCCNDDHKFLHSDGNYYMYTQFGEVFPDWCQPTEKFPLPLREYVFYNFQDELVASTSGAIPCTNIPSSYNHALRDVEGRIDELCNRGS